MKILHILASADASLPAENIILGLKAQGFDQCVALPRQTKAFRELEKAGLCLFPQIFRAPSFAQKFLMRFLIKRERPDIVHCWTSRSANLAGKAGGQAATPVITGWLSAASDPEKFKNCAHLIGATPSVANIRFIPNPPDIVTQPPLDRATLATPREAKVLLAFSRQHPRQGLDTLLASLQKMPQVIVWLETPNIFRREIESLAQNLGILDRVRFLTPRPDHAALLRAADICVLPARAEKTTFIIIEAFAAGTPVVACANSDAAALIENDATGLLSPASDAPALVATLTRLLQDDILRRRLIAQGYAAYIKDHTREAVLRKWTEFFKSVKSSAPNRNGCPLSSNGERA
ncbi:MAG: glycosyltransferase family 4 protein [Alphaproteobacteria bacterium]|nr:glycosyltransferase family 4 protein [Alphaproteobacteria bacterium]